MTEVLEVDLTDPALYPGSKLRDVFTELRAAGSVHRNPSVDIGLGREAPPFWSVVRHAEIQRANRDFESLSSADGVALAKHTAGMVSNLTGMDPPDHTRMRHLIAAGFTPRMVGRLEAHIRAFDPTSGLTADDQRRAERELFGYAEGLARHKGAADRRRVDAHRPGRNRRRPRHRPPRRGGRARHVLRVARHRRERNDPQRHLTGAPRLT